MRNPKVASMLRILVAAYLIYLGVGIIRKNDGSVPTPVIIGFAALFIVCGAGYIIYSLKMMKQAENQQTNETPSDYEKSEEDLSSENEGVNIPEEENIKIEEKES